MNKTNNPHLFVTKANSSAGISSVVFSLINQYMKYHNSKTINLLDIGGGRGWGELLYDKKHINYYCLDLKKSERIGNITYIKGDITDPSLSANVSADIGVQFDIIFSKDTFEHILNPWDATANMVNLLKSGGIITIFTPFSWRYHASPYDAYRYTHTGLQYIVERLGKIKKIHGGYIRCGNINGFWKNKKDHTLDGTPHLNCLESFYAGVKIDGYQFDKSNLDSDLSWDQDDTK